MKHEHVSELKTSRGHGYYHPEELDEMTAIHFWGELHNSIFNDSYTLYIVT